MATLKDIAKIAGVSMMTVSKALKDAPDISEATKIKIREISKQLHYIPNASASSLVSKKTYTLGIIFDERSNLGFSHPFFGELLTKIKKEAENKGYDILLIGKQVGNYVESYIDHCIQKGVDGIIVISNIRDEDEYEKIIASTIPMVFVDNYSEKKHSVYTNNEKAIKEILTYLIDNGHKKIGFISGDYRYTSGTERFETYKDVMEENNFEINLNWVRYAHKFTIQSGYEQVLDILNSNDYPTALVCTGDYLALGALKAITAKGLNVPEDISITGFDNALITDIVTPPITSYSQNSEKIAEEAIKILLEEIAGNKSQPLKKRITGGLVVRKSVKKIKETV